MEGGRSGFSSLPWEIQFQIAVIGPLLFGMVCGFLLGETEAGWWASQAVASAAGVVGGTEFPSREAAVRGLAAGLLFGLGIVIAHAISGDDPQARVPDPIGLLVIVTSTLGGALGALGGWVATRRR